MKHFWRRYGLIFLGVVAGALAGFLYWRWVGCPDGSCPLTSSPVAMVFWGAAMGGLLLSVVKRGDRNNSGKDEGS